MTSCSSFLGHKSRCFDIRFSSDYSKLITSSEDGTTKIWNVNTRKCLVTLLHSKDSEVLRSSFLSNDYKLVCTCGADGQVIIWDNPSGDGINYVKKMSLPHPKDSQIYGCEHMNTSINGVMSLCVITAADNLLSIWDLTSRSDPRLIPFTAYDVRTRALVHIPTPTTPGIVMENETMITSPVDVDALNNSLNTTTEILSQGSMINSPDIVQMTQSLTPNLTETLSPVASFSTNYTQFGGHRNQQNLAFLFDLKICPSHNHIVSVALSDGTIRIVDVQEPNINRVTIKIIAPHSENAAITSVLFF